MKKYLLFPGFVPSKNDGDRHFIGFRALCRLYGVPLSQCLNARDAYSLQGWDTSKLIELHPRLDGDYTLPA